MLEQEAFSPTYIAYMKAHALDSLVNPHATDNLTSVWLFGFFQFTSWKKKLSD